MALQLQRPYRARKSIGKEQWVLQEPVVEIRNEIMGKATLWTSKGKAMVFAVAGLTLAIGGCARDGQIDVSSGVGITASLNGCPTVAVADGTGDVTLFTSPNDRSAQSIDVVAAMTNVRATCGQSGEQIVNSVTFDVMATRSNATGSRSLTLPYYSVVMRGGRDVVAKRVGSVTITFADGQRVAVANGSAYASINANLTTLPEDVKVKLTRKRNPGDVDAALDPLADPSVRDALAAVSFEHLIGFQLTDEQIAYNATR